MDGAVNKPIYHNFRIRPGRAKKNRGFGDKNLLLLCLRNNKGRARQGVNLTPRISFNNHSQKSIVKVSYMPNKYAKQWRAHGRYLAREGAQKKDEQGSGFDAKDDDIKIAQKLAEWQDAGDARLWKIIISPEQASRLSLKEHATAVVKQMEADLGTRLQWIGIDHYNTDNYHAHLVIRGKKDDGLDLELDKDYIRNVIRQRSEEHATRVLGFRLKTDVLERRSRAIQLKHVTELDREIKNKLDDENCLLLDFNTKNNYELEKRLQLMGRLTYLKSLNLAERIDSEKWSVDPGFLSFLRHAQLENDIIKSRRQRTDLPILFNQLNTKGEELLGRVVTSGFSEFQNESRYFHIEGVDGSLHYVPINLSLQKKRDNYEIQNGDIVYFQRRELQKNGKTIPYIFAETAKTLNDLRDTWEVNFADVYILNFLQDKGYLPKAGDMSSGLRKEFVSLVDERIEYLKSKQILNNSLEIDHYNLKVQLEPRLRAGLKLSKHQDIDKE